MDRKKSQCWNFAFEAIPAMFHSQTIQFYELLERDGLDFLKFWWDYVGEQLPDEKRRPFEGIDYKIFPLEEKTNVIILSLPGPYEDGEMHFMGLIGKPERRFAWVRLPSTRIIALISHQDPDFPRGTEIGDLTPRMIFVPIGAGPEPDEEVFTKIVLRAARTGSLTSES